MHVYKCSKYNNIVIRKIADYTGLMGVLNDAVNECTAGVLTDDDTYIQFK